MRSIQAQSQLCVRAQWIMSGLMAAVIVLFLVFGYRTGTQRLKELHLEIASRSQKLQTDQARTDTMKFLAEEVVRLDAKLQKFNKKLPRTAELGEFIRDMTQIAQQCAIRKVDSVPGLVKRQELYNEIPITMSFQGEFSGVFSFLRQLEDMQRLARVKNITVKTKDAKLGQVEVNMAMNIYFSEL